MSILLLYLGQSGGKVKKGIIFHDFLYIIS